MNFDRVADIYDQTRGLPHGVPEQIANRIVAVTASTPETQFLELGVGTGRIALPFVQQGYSYTGVDISEQMMDQFRAKLPAGTTNLSLLNGDVTDLPLADQSFDVAITVHLLHLVPEWKQVLREIRRVLKPNGWYVLGNDGGHRDSAGSAIRRQWSYFAREAGAALRPDHGNTAAVEAELTAMGCRMAVYQVAQWQREFRPIDLLERLRDRTFSHSWTVSDQTLEQIHQQMLTWASEQYGDLDQTVTFEGAFTLWVSRFPTDTNGS